MVVRAAALLAVAGNLALYFAVADRLPEVSTWWDVAIVGFLVIPAAFALVGLALPAARSRWLLPATLALIGAAVGLELTDRELSGNFVKLAAATGAGWVFLRFFEDVSWIVLVAILIVPIDIVSVARGPTRTLIEDQPGVFDVLSISFPVPGDPSSMAQLGLPDVLFFALFVGAAARFGLRTGATWLACAVSFGATLAITHGTDASGFPALPLLSAAFVAVNADILWSRFINRLRNRRLANRPS